MNTKEAGNFDDVLLAYIGRGWKLIPVPFKAKKPTLKAWQSRTITADNVRQYFNRAPMNIGVQLGPKSNGLVDVDLDCSEAIQLAHHFLPKTGSVFGRASKPNSHALYYIKDVPATAGIKFVDADAKCLIEFALRLFFPAAFINLASRLSGPKMMSRQRFSLSNWNEWCVQ
jgi:Bifunctional DNA primase/polymerase, N-terminal